MKKRNHPIYWFIINLVLLLGSMFMTWQMLVWIDLPAEPTPGWGFIFLKLLWFMEALFEHDFDASGVLSLLEGVGAIFIIGYILFIIIRLAIRKVFVGSKVRSIALVSIAIFFLLSNLAMVAFSGFWFFTAGIFSSAILEWEYSRAHIDLLTGKRTRKK